VKIKEDAEMEQVIWISFELGIDGDYENLYRWLDAHNAVECGDNLAYIKKYQYNTDLLKEIKPDLKTNVKLRKKDRIYLLFKREDGAHAGRFIFGGRKPSPWEGYAARYEEEAVDEALDSKIYFN